ncbi:MAG: hypothetical protein VX835_01980 [Pseudomonadota bacterium]|nr:hypothetical protein [Pseudomonadota bacterium]
MLKWLSIDNYILIDSLKLDFQLGFNVLTGPTGSGKSMITGALGILFGARTPSDVALDESKPIVISACLQASKQLPADLDMFLNEDQCFILERTIKKGKSIYKCGGKSIKLVDIIRIREAHFCHRQQHQQLDLFNDELHLDWLDDFGRIQREQIEEAYLHWQKCKHQLTLLRQLKSSHDEVTIEHFYQELADFFQNMYTYDELNQQLDIEVQKKRTLDMIQSIYREFSSADLENKITQIKTVYPDEPISDALMKYADVQDKTLMQIDAFIQENGDQSRHDSLQETLHSWHELSRKHRCQPYELHDVFSQIEETMQTLSNLDENQAHDACQKAERNYQGLADELTKQRQSIAIELAKNMTVSIQALGMQHALFFINIKQGDPSKRGSDQCQFLMSTNPGQMPQSLKETLSGGELSRVGLALQEHCPSNMKPIQLLDEVDVGISGHVAEQVAYLLFKRSKKHQIIAISHLPQMAMMADQHGYISKNVVEEQARIGFKWLNSKERIDALAELLAGKKINQAAKEHAKELLFSANQEKEALV